jgi:integrase
MGMQLSDHSAEETGRPVLFELTEQTRQALDEYLRAAGKRPGEFLFTGRRGSTFSRFSASGPTPNPCHHAFGIACRKGLRPGAILPQ